MNLTIRPAVPADLGAIFGLVRELADYERLSGEVEADEEMIAAALFAPQPRVFAEMALWHREVAGFALWFYTYSTFKGRHGIWLEDLFVRPACRGMGIGKALMATVARRCAEEELGRFEWSALDWNAPAIGFYEALGAVRMDDWRIFRLSGDDLIRLGETGE